MNDHSVNWFAKILAKVPLRTLLIVPFVLQTVGVVTLVGYFSYCSGQEAVENLANQLMREENERVQQHLNSYLGKAQEVNRTNVDAFESGILDLNNFNALGKYFYRQVQAHNFAYLNFGRKKGEFIGAGYGLGNRLEIGEILRYHFYSVDNQGNRLSFVDTRNTLILCGLSLVIAMGTGGLIAYWIAKLILRLSRASQSMSKGEWQETLSEDLYYELRLRKAAEDQLRESQYFIERITELTPNLLHIYNHIEQRNVYMNRSVAQLLGYSAAEVQSMGVNLFATICHPDDLSMVYEAIQQTHSLKDDEFVEIEYRLQDAQGQWRWLYSRDTVFSRTTDGRVKETLGTSYDITNRKQTELELRKSRDLREAIYNESTDAIFLVDVPNSLIIDCNSRAVEMFAVANKEELIGTNGQNLQKHPFTDEQIVMILEDIDNLGFWSQEVEYITKKGHNFWGNLAVKRINMAGKTIDLVRVTDISKRKEVELALLKSEKRFQQISASSPGVIYIIVKRWGGFWYYEYMSHAFEDIHEITVEQIMVNPHLCFEQFHPDDCVGYEAAVAYSIETMSPFNYEWRIITPSGKVKWIKARSRPEQRENGDIVFYGIILDVSDRKQVEEELQQTESKLRLANQELQKLVNIDGLTQIANRRCFDQSLEQEWERLYREQQPLSLLLFDVDYFKLYNDSYGHQMGDDCLIKMALAVQQVVSSVLILNPLSHKTSCTKCVALFL
jgi:PAS domain S-box-containing protein